LCAATEKVWDNFDRGKAAKAAMAANEDEGEAEGDMFSQAGMTTE